MLHLQHGLCKTALVKHSLSITVPSIVVKLGLACPCLANFEHFSLAVEYYQYNSAAIMTPILVSQ